MGEDVRRWEIYGRADSSAVAKVMWMAEELALPVVRHDWGGRYGGNDDPSYRKIQPAGRIPALRLPNGEALWESNTIIRFLAATHPHTGFLPQAALPRARVESWMDWANAFSMAVGKLRTTYKAPGATVAQVLEASTTVGPVLRILETQLSDRPYVAGDALTAADFALGVWGHRLFRCPDPVPLKSYPALRSWLSRLQGRPAFQTHVVAQVSAGPQTLGSDPS